jgi:hypothetical protein
LPPLFLRRSNSTNESTKNHFSIWKVTKTWENMILRRLSSLQSLGQFWGFKFWEFS